MAGGTWLSQNKVRPGAYINFKAVEKSSMTVGDRGIVAIPLELSWGEEGKLTEVLSSELLDGSSKAKVGFTAFDSESKLLAAALSYCYKALVYRATTGGLKASATIAESKLKATAKYTGTLGNKITIAIEEDSGVFTVITYVDGETVDTQKVSEIAELTANDYVVFSVDSESMAESELAETAGTTLSGGENGVYSETEEFPKYLNALQTARFQTMCCFSTNPTVKMSVLNFIKQQRDEEGRYIQGVMSSYDGADYEGIINVANGVVVDGVEFSAKDSVAIVAGMTAGANFNESNTARVVTGATDIIGAMTNEEIKKALQNGKFLFSESASGNIKVEQDINSLHTYTQTKKYSFSKNRVIRTLDEIGITTKQTWEDSYMGKFDNTDEGRGLFKDALIKYGKELQRLNGIQEFEGADDIEIKQGNDIDSVLCTWNVKPVDSMEKLYLLCNVNN